MASGVTRLEVDGLPVTVERKAIRRLYLRVEADGAVRVSVPRQVPEEELVRLVRDRRGWIDRRRSALAAYAPRYVSGERFPLWGAWVLLEAREAGHRPFAALEAGVLALGLPPGGGAEAAKAAVDALYRRELSAALPALEAEREAATGLRARSIQIRDMTSRWGSCTPRTGAIRINLQLAKYPPQCLRYLLTHELAHLLEKGHNARFYSLLDRFEPDWRAERLRLRAGAPVLPPAEDAATI